MFTRRYAVILAAIASAVLPSVADASPGFEMPSKNVMCGVGTSNGPGQAAGLFCSAAYITKGAYDGAGVVKLGSSGKAHVVPSGNDMLIFIGGGNADNTYSKRPTLRYGKTFRRAGYRCVSRPTGLTCTRGGHGFHLSRKSQRYF